MVESGQWPPQCSLPELFLRNHLPSQKLIYSSWSEVKWSEVAQSCPTLCYPMDCSPPGSSIRGIHQARILEWVAISFSRGSSQPRDRTQVSHIAGRCFNLWATREAHSSWRRSQIEEGFLNPYQHMHKPSKSQWRAHSGVDRSIIVSNSQRVCKIQMCTIYIKLQL